MITNFWKVTDKIYRGGLPTIAQLADLKALGVNTVINLMVAGDQADAEQVGVANLAMRYIHIPESGAFEPHYSDVETVIRLMDDPAMGVVFVHCLHGDDRTGTVVACYRIQYEDEANADALLEAEARGMNRLQVLMKEFIEDFKPQKVT
jgi:protein tyrosine/serine phosphatase